MAHVTPQQMAEVLFPGVEFSADERAALAAGQAGVYRFGPADEAAWRRDGTLPVHPDPDVVVVPQVCDLGEGHLVIRWYKPVKGTQQ